MDNRNRQKVQGIRKYNSVWVGVITGIIVPFVGYALLLMINESIGAVGWQVNGNTFGGFSDKLIGLFAICLNLIPFGIFQKNRMDDAMRGVFMPTMGYIMMWMYFYRAEIMD
jgi:hypothetical protein